MARALAISLRASELRAAFKAMNKLPADILLTQCLEANAYYNGRMKYRASYDLLEYNVTAVIAEAFLMRAETLTADR